MTENFKPPLRWRRVIVKCKNTKKETNDRFGQVSKTFTLFLNLSKIVLYYRVSCRSKINTWRNLLTYNSKSAVRFVSFALYLKNQFGVRLPTKPNHSSDDTQKINYKHYIVHAHVYPVLWL